MDFAQQLESLISDSTQPSPPPPDETLTDEIIVECVKRHFDVPAGAATVRKHDRSYSSVWQVSVAGKRETQTFFVKAPGINPEKETRLQQRAEQLSRGLAHYTLPEVHFDRTLRLVVSKGFSGRSILSLIQHGDLLHPIRSFPEAENAVHAAGSWLKLYHQERRTGSISQPLLRSLKRRSDSLALLASEFRRRLCMLVGDGFEDEVVVTHGDYSASNLLWDGRGLAIIDFGISEWTEMSPFWDVATFLVTLDRYTLFSPRTTLFWFRPLLTKLKRSFLAGYGRDLPNSERAAQACLAVRHFSSAFTAGPIQAGDRRARWHLSQLEHILSTSEFASSGEPH